jgi:hypothetical protein
VHAALAEVRLAAGDPKGAVRSSLLALRAAPAHDWAVDTAARAAEGCGCAREVAAWVEAASIAGSA